VDDHQCGYITKLKNKTLEFHGLGIDLKFSQFNWQNTQSHENNHIGGTEIGNIFLNTKKVICKVILSSTPYPLFQRYLQSKEN
jgi:hypothetical protein